MPSREYVVQWPNGLISHYMGVSRPDVREFLKQIYPNADLTNIKIIPTHPSRAERIMDA